MRSDPEVQAVVSAFAFHLPRLPVTGRSGELLGRGAGSSLEFHEYRQYMPGDDIRHLDWMAYARTDQLMVRLFRDEVSPEIEIFLDGSRSMTSGRGTKAWVARQLSASLMLLAAGLGGRPKLHFVGNEWPPQQFSVDELAGLETVEFDAARSLHEVLTERSMSTQRAAVRIIISDFLFGHDAAQFLNRVTQGTATTWLIQLLSRWEAEPQAVGGRRLVDIEQDWQLDLVIDDTAVAAYRKRLARLQENLQSEARRRRARFVTGVSDQGLRGICEQVLVPSGLLKVS